MPPPKTTIIFNFPEKWLVGIDTQFFNTNNLIRGIKLVPSGLHLLHYAADENSIRSGIWLNCEEEKVVIIEWDTVEEKISVDGDIGELNVSKYHSQLVDLYPYMISYPADPDWISLTKYINHKLIGRMLPENGMVSSIHSSEEENCQLIEALRESVKNRLKKNDVTQEDLMKDEIYGTIQDQSKEEIHYTIIDPRKLRDGISIEQITRDYLDRSWYLQELIKSTFDNNELQLIAEFQLAFVLVLIFANYSSGIQWLNLLRLFAKSEDFINTNSDFYSTLLRILKLQLAKLPAEYLGGGLIDDKELVAVMQNLNDNILDSEFPILKKKLIDLKDVELAKIGIYLNESTEDEEDAPVVV